VPVKNLKNAYLRVSVETREQLNAAVKTSFVDLIYIDAGLFAPEDWKEIVSFIHKGIGGMGKLAALRLPQVWREKSELFFQRNENIWKTAGFDLFLARNFEEILWLKENGIGEDLIIADHTVYGFNKISENMVSDITGFEHLTETLSLELNSKELKTLVRDIRKNNLTGKRELVVYGRAPLMVTAQCLRKTSIGCDRRISQLWMKDRTGAMMPVRNCCVFCMNTIYNSVPTVVYDLTEEVNEIAPDHIRYEFTIENEQQVNSVLSGNVPEQFTRGHFKRGVL